MPSPANHDVVAFWESLLGAKAATYDDLLITRCLLELARNRERLEFLLRKKAGQA